MNTLPPAPVAVTAPAIIAKPNPARAAKIAVLTQAIISLKAALAAYEAELARLLALP